MKIEFITFLKREIYRFLVLYKQTIIPALISSLLYIVVFGTTLGTRISSIEGIAYINYIVPGLAMMAVINQSFILLYYTGKGFFFMHSESYILY